MKATRHPYRVEIARWDPARAQIAADIVAAGGTPQPDSSFAYGFRSAEYRDRVAAEIRGCYGTDCLSVVTEMAPEAGAARSVGKPRAARP